MLIVEDDFQIRGDLHQVLEEEGYQVVNAADGRDALEILRAGPRPSVVLLDLLMPRVSGSGLLEALQKEAAWADLPVIIMSVRAPPTGWTGPYFRKPFDLSALLRSVRAAVQP